MIDAHAVAFVVAMPHEINRSATVGTIMTLSWINLWMAIAMSLAGQTLLKAGATSRDALTGLAQFLDPRTILGLSLYVVAAFL